MKHLEVSFNWDWRST